MASKPTHVMAIDQGTTGSTVLVFDRRGRIAGRAYSEFRQHYPKPGWVEHDAEEIWRVTLAVARQAIRKAKIKAAALAGIGITNQRETTVVWDRRTGQPIHRAIVWQDRRTADVCAQLKDEGAEAEVRAKTGLVLDPYFSAHQGRLDPRQRARRPRARRGRRSRVRHHRQLAHLEAHRRQGARHRSDQRLAHPALRHPRPRLGSRAAAALRRADGDGARGAAVERRHRRDRAAPPRRAGADRGHRRRPAGRALRPGLLRARHGEEHLRHRLLRADADRQRGGRLGARPGDHDRLRRGRGADLRARRLGLHRRRADPVAARRPQDPEERRRERGAGAQGRLDARRLRRAGLRRSRRAVLGSRRARRHPRPHARRRAASTSCAPRSSRSPTRPATSSRPWPPTPASRSPRSASTAAPPPTTS